MTRQNMNTVSFIDTNTGAEVNVPIFNIPMMSDERWHELAKQQRATHNQAIVNEIMENWKCTELEAWAALEYGKDTLAETQNAIAAAVTYKRRLRDMFPESLRFLRNEVYKGQSFDDDFLRDEAREMTDEEAQMFVYEWNQIDEYTSMTEAEKQAAIWGATDEEA